MCARCPSPLRGLLGDGTVLSSRYRVISVLGCGAMGAVYLAEDRRLEGRRCAIKENRPDGNEPPEVLTRMREQFLAEANVLARLDHAGLPKVSDFFIEDQREYLVMDYVEGEDLASMLQRARQPLPEEAVLNWADQVLDALAYLHSHSPQPIIHRDIKPANLRVNLRDKVKLVDFGLVKVFDSSNPATKIELRGLGTPAYAPLEQFAGSQDHTDARSDVYALGATMYHLLTNLYPPDVHQRLLKPELMPPPRQLNPSLSDNTERAILRAIEVHPTRRFQSAAEMRAALAGQTPAKPGSAPMRLPAATISPWSFGLAGLVLVLMILAGVGWIMFGRMASPPVIASPTAAAITTTAAPALLVEFDTPTATLMIPNTLPPAFTATPETVDTPTPAPSPTVTPTATAVPAQPQTVPRSVLTGTIAFAVHNGKDYDLYLGQADGSGVRFFRRSASQPAFSPNGSRLAFHSWRLDGWGLVTVDISGANETLVARFVEDQLPTWSADGRELIFLSRREGDRKSRLYKVASAQTGDDGVVLGEGEYPSVGQSGQLAFKGWGNSGAGLRLAAPNLADMQGLTDSNEDTAPALSPDGRRVAFMSRRDGNWEIYVVDADGANLRRLTDDPAEDGLPVWSPDGRALAFASSRDGVWAIWAMLPTGAGQRQLFEMGGSPDGFVGTNRDASRGWAEERISWAP